jgi:hypothetical protein
LVNLKPRAVQEERPAQYTSHGQTHVTVGAPIAAASRGDRLRNCRAWRDRSKLRPHGKLPTTRPNTTRPITTRHWQAKQTQAVALRLGASVRGPGVFRRLGGRLWGLTGAFRRNATCAAHGRRSGPIDRHADVGSSLACTARQSPRLCNHHRLATNHDDPVAMESPQRASWS